MSEGFHVCNRSRGHCPILVMSPEPSGLFCAACVRPDPQAALRTQTIIIERLASKYGKVRQSQGLTAQGTVVAVFASRETGTWTITVTSPTGLMCPLSVGTDFEAFPLPPPGDPV